MSATEKPEKGAPVKTKDSGTTDQPRKRRRAKYSRFEKPIVFIASSGKARRLTKELANKLNDSGRVEARPWTSDEAFPIGRHLLQTLIDHSQEADLAVVIFTGDETQVSEDGETSSVPRDNCVFELGLFVGAMASAGRCALLVSGRAEKQVQRELSDIAGHLYLKIPGLSGLLRNSRTRESKIASWAEQIEDMTKREGRFRARPRLAQLTTDELLELEASEARKSGLLPHGLVIVKEDQPPEHQLRYAGVVWDNMILRAVNYQFLFSPTQENFPKIALMFRSLVAAGLLPRRQYASYQDRMSEPEKKRAIEKQFKGKEAKKKIQELRKRLFIRFTPDNQAGKSDERWREFPPAQFCIHSAANQRRRKGYLKIGDGYAPMSDRMAQEFYLQYRSLAGWPPDRVLQSSLTKKAREQFQAYVEDMFPKDLREVLIEACFGSENSAVDGA